MLARSLIVTALALHSVCYAQADSQLTLDRDQLGTRIAEAQDTLVGENAQAKGNAAVQQKLIEKQLRAGTMPELTADQLKMEHANQERMDAALRRVSEDGKTKLAQVKASDPAATSLQAVGGPAPQPLTPTPLTPATPKKDTRIVVTADAMIWSSEHSIMIAKGNVDVQHPDFHLTSDELEVHMIPNKKGEEKAAPAAPQSAAMDTGRLQKVIARGPKVIVEKEDENGEMVTGQCGLLYHDGATQETTLRIWPQVSKGLNAQIAEEAGCVMILSKAGTLTTRGRSKAVILQEAAKPKKPKAPVPAATPVQPQQ
jgi:lipopolysaccharide export system protein LptA